jgi:uncharacterized protein YneF (UPF0154 family)
MIFFNIILIGIVLSIVLIISYFIYLYISKLEFSKETLDNNEVFQVYSGEDGIYGIYISKEQAMEEIKKLNPEWNLATMEQILSAYRNGFESKYMGWQGDSDARVKMNFPYFKIEDSKVNGTEGFSAYVYGKKPKKYSELANYVLPFNDTKWSQF